jgi:hypothetical protein
VNLRGVKNAGRRIGMSDVHQAYGSFAANVRETKAACEDTV